MKSISRAATRSSTPRRTRVPRLANVPSRRRRGGVGVQSSQFIRGTAPGERERTFGDFIGKHHALGRSRARGDESSAESPERSHQADRARGQLGHDRGVDWALSSMNSTFATAVGTSKLPNWSSVLGGAVTTREGGLGVASFVRVTNFSLGYAVLADADAVGVSIAGYVHNGETDAVYPNTDSISKAVKAKGLQFGNNGDDAHRLTASIAPALETGVWPFTTYSYVVLRTGINGFTTADRLRNGATCQNVKQTVEFGVGFSSEQSLRIASQYGFVSLRDELGALVLARLVADVHCAGVIAAESAASVEVSRTVSSITAPAALNNPLRTIQALHEAHNASSTLNVTELTTPRDALSNIITDGGMAIGIDLVGTALWLILLRLLFFQLEMRAAVQ